MKSSIKYFQNSLTSKNLAFSLPVIVLFLVTTANHVRFVDWDFDDSYIVYRIADNLVHGNGWSYNAGEAHNPSTSVLNTILIALIGYITKNIPLAAHLLGSLWIFLSGLLLYILLRKDFGDVLSLFGSIGIIYLLAYDSSWGLETHLFFFLSLLFVTLESHCKNVWPVLGLLVLARPDGLVFAGIKWLKSFFRDRTLSLGGLLQLGLVLLPWVIFSLYQFHQVFPDTLAQKVWQGNSGYWGSGLIYLSGLEQHLFSSGYGHILLLAGSIAGVVFMLSNKSCFLYLVAFATIQQVVYVFFNVFNYHWYYNLLNATMFVSTVYAVGSITQIASRRVEKATRFDIRKSPRITTILMASLLCFSVCSIKQASENKVLDTRNEAYKNVASVINTHYPEGALAFVEVGTIGYYTTRKIIDLTGLVSDNGEFITGERNDLFFSNPPRIVLLHSPIWLFEAAIYHDVRFKVLYDLVQEIDSPHFPMQYFVLKEKHGPLTQTELEAYTQSHYQPFALISEPNLDNLEELIEGHCFLDEINGKMTNKPTISVPKTVVHFRGWAVDKTQEHIPQDTRVLLISGDEKVYSIVATRAERQDVAANLNNENYLMAGYEAEGSILHLPPGNYKIRVIQSRGTTFTYCDFDTRLTIH